MVKLTRSDEVATALCGPQPLFFGNDWGSAGSVHPGAARGHKLCHNSAESEHVRCPLCSYAHLCCNTSTLAQNCHCEFCCGMHLTCKSTPVTRDRKGSMKRPEKGIKKLPSPEPV